jgi:hypothetical protein
MGLGGGSSRSCTAFHGSDPLALLAKARDELIFVFLPSGRGQIRVDSARLRISAKWSAKEQDMWLGPDELNNKTTAWGQK